MSLLATRLDRLRPAGTAPSLSAIRVEPGSADLVVSHRFFRGLSVGATIAGDRTEIYWLRVHTLNRSDDFDAVAGMGWPVFSPETEGSEWMSAAVEHFVGELARPFLVMAEFRGPARRPASVRIEVGERCVWTERRPLLALPVRRRVRFSAAFTTSITEIQERLGDAPAMSGD